MRLLVLVVLVVLAVLVVVVVVVGGGGASLWGLPGLLGASWRLNLVFLEGSCGFLELSGEASSSLLPAAAPAAPAPPAPPALGLRGGPPGAS